MAVTYVSAKLKMFNAINIKNVNLEPDYSALKISYMIWGKSLNFSVPQFNQSVKMKSNNSTYFKDFCED